MSGKTFLEVVVWLLGAMSLGFVIGWAVRRLQGRAADQAVDVGTAGPSEAVVGMPPASRVAATVNRERESWAQETGARETASATDDEAPAATSEAEASAADALGPDAQDAGEHELPGPLTGRESAPAAATLAEPVVEKATDDVSGADQAVSEGLSEPVGVPEQAGKPSAEPVAADPAPVDEAVAEEVTEAELTGTETVDVALEAAAVEGGGTGESVAAAPDSESAPVAEDVTEAEPSGTEATEVAPETAAVESVSGAEPTVVGKTDAEPVDAPEAAVVDQGSAAEPAAAVASPVAEPTHADPVGGEQAPVPPESAPAQPAAVVTAEPAQDYPEDRMATPQELVASAVQGPAATDSAATESATTDSAKAASAPSTGAGQQVAGPLMLSGYTHAAAPLADGSAPGEAWVIKGNADSGLYHTEQSPYYSRTRAEAWFRTEDEARADGFTPYQAHDAAEAHTPAEPSVAMLPGYLYAAAPTQDGTAPGAEWVIKGNADSGLFHTDASPYFGRTKAEAWFRNEAEAEADGFRKYR